MLSKCCHCLCSREYSALTRVLACYPQDGRPNPIPSRVQELINWGIHDVERMRSIQEILNERIQLDIDLNNLNNISVGMKVLCELLEKVRLLNNELSTTLASFIVQLIRYKNPSFLLIAQSSIDQELNFTETILLPVPVNRIINSFFH